MITREDIRELAEFKGGDADCAISFYFQPSRPHDKSHREQAILTKDLVQQALREAEKDGRNGCAREDLQKILAAAGDWSGHRSQAKAVFACGSRNIWREFDLPPQLARTQVFVNRRFRLKELAEVLGAQPRLRLVLLDRHRARFFDLHLDEVKEGEALFRPLPRRGRGDGFGGVDAGHVERSANDEALHHFKSVADALKKGLERGTFDHLAIGSQDATWREFEVQLHPYVKKSLLGHFSAEVGAVTEQQVREQGGRILKESLAQHRREQVKEALSEAKSDRRGVTGLRRVLRSLETGEVQTVLMADDYTAHAVECGNCGHLDAHMVRFCAVCGSATHEVRDVCDAIVRAALRRDVELVYVKEDPDFDRVGGIAALLRFRVDGKASRVALAS